MKMILQILLAIVLHPIATILAIINVLGRDDVTGIQKLIWALVAIIPIGPIIYVTVGGGSLW
jgi:hypothetical protein